MTTEKWLVRVGTVAAGSGILLAALVVAFHAAVISVETDYRASVTLILIYLITGAPFLVVSTYFIVIGRKSVANWYSAAYGIIVVIFYVGSHWHYWVSVLSSNRATWKAQIIVPSLLLVLCCLSFPTAAAILQTSRRR